MVRKDTLAVDASADRLLEALGGDPDAHPCAGNVEADNELAAHVLELKCGKPATDLAAQARDFAAYVRHANRALSQWDCRLMPTGMHPFMDPARESRIWPYEDSRIYEAYDRLFGVRGHGWFNIQSVHLNLPFRGDAEFARLHNAISLLLPLLPALAASSPIHDGAHGGWLDGRLKAYVGNQRRLPSIIGGIIPEPVGSEGEYRERILAPMYRDIAPLDTDGIMQEEWLNSRAAIARFGRSSIEIRCLDTQERPTADLALCHWVTSVLRYLCDMGEDLLSVHRRIPEGELRALFLETARAGMAAEMPAEFPFRAFGTARRATAGEMLKALTAQVFPGGDAGADFGPAIDLILTRGNLAERILRAAGAEEKRSARAAGDDGDATGRARAGATDRGGAAWGKHAGYPVFERLCDCLETDAPFAAP